MSDPGDAIISIRPVFAEAILAGTKTIELRRRLPKIDLGTKLWIYATRPIANVIGVAVIVSVARAHPRAIWRRHKQATGINYSTFTAYFTGAEEAIAIVLSEAHRIAPISIQQLRTMREGFHPPQVIARLTSIEAKRLRELASVESNIANTNALPSLAWGRRR